ncbi:MAG TPA: hypothetical protein PLU35_09085 [Phycisphaerales bacterium]|nr:hypothetical protein [Phycisphaerales bacterium]
MAKRKAKATAKKAGTKRKVIAAPRETDASEAHTLADVAQAREIFWQNVMREMLTSLAMASAMRPAPAETTAETPAASSGEDDGDMLDGRLAVITAQGQRIPIAAVIPLLACSVGTSQRDRLLSTDLQCSVYQIATPAGEVYTLPLHEIRGFHALSEDLMQQLEQAAVDQGTREKPSMPFGFEAFTSVVRSRQRTEAEQRAGGGPSGRE